MKHLPFIWKHLRHNWVRTASTALAMAACIFLFCTLETANGSINAALATAKASRLVTRNHVSLTFDLPLSYEQKIAGIPGVKRVAASNWFGGVYQDRKNFFPNFAVDGEEYFQIYPEYIVSPEDGSAFASDLKGCIIGPDLAEKFGWEAGDVFQLESFIPIYRKDQPFEFVVRGIYGVDDVKNPGTFRSAMFFHWKYLYEGTSQKVKVATYHTEVEDPDQALAIAKTIDALFENTDAQTKTETESAFRAGFISLGGNLALLLHSVGLAVTFTILLVLANTMSMAIRERRTEIGILKTLGFSNFRVLSIILTESVILGAIGGGLGVGLGQAMILLLPKIPMMAELLRGFPELRLTPLVSALGFGLALLIGLAAGLVPAVLSYRARITGLLRQV